MGEQKSLVIALVTSLFLGIVDYLLGAELSLSVFYTMPIMYVSWYGGKSAGLILVVATTTILVFSELAASYEYSSIWIPAWSVFVRLCFFVIIWKLLTLVHEKLLLEESLADKDPFTGLTNRHFFRSNLIENIFEHNVTLSLLPLHILTWIILNM